MHVRRPDVTSDADAIDRVLFGFAIIETKFAEDHRSRAARAAAAALPRASGLGWLELRWAYVRELVMREVAMV